MSRHDVVGRRFDATEHSGPDPRTSQYAQRISHKSAYYLSCAAVCHVGYKLIVIHKYAALVRWLAGFGRTIEMKLIHYICMFSRIRRPFVFFFSISQVIFMLTFGRIDLSFACVRIFYFCHITQPLGPHPLGSERFRVGESYDRESTRN